MKKILSLLSLLMLFVMTASADTATFSMAKKWTSTSATDNGVTVTFSDVVGNAQTGYFKFTKSNTLTINAGTNVISAVTITATATDKNSKKGAVSVDKGTITHSPDNVETTWEGSESVIVITNGSSGGDWRVASIVVTFAAGTAPSLTVSPKELSFSLNPSVPTKTQSFTLTGKNLTNGTYDLAVPSVTGLTVTPTQFTVAEGAVSQEVQVTYASTEAVAKATADITATVGEQTAKVTLSYQSRAVAYTQSTVSEAATWNWGKLTETVELSGETTPAKDSEFLLADLDDRINFVEDFGDAKALKMQVMQFPSRAGYAQGNIIKFKTSVPGTLDVDFCNTGKDRPYRYLNVNGENTTFKSNTADKVSATGISIPAGDVVLKGYIPDAADPQSREGDVVGETMLRWYKITFTPKAFDATFDFANNPQSWPVSTEIADYETGKVTDLTVSNVKLTAIQNNEYMGNILYKADGSSPAVFRVGKFNAFKLTAPEGKALVGVAVTMATDGQAFDFEASNGAIAANAWTGNATEVTFTTSNNRQIAKIEITLADENSETIKPAATVEAANIAEAMAVESGKTVKLTITSARVNAVNGGTAYVEDATGAILITTNDLVAGKSINGTITGKLTIEDEMNYSTMEVGAKKYTIEASAIEVNSSDATMDGTVMTGAEAGAQANYGKLVTLENVDIAGSGQNKTLTINGVAASVKARDIFGVLSDYTWPAKASKITGVVVFYSTGWFLAPISAEAIVPYVQPTEVTFDFENNNLGLTYGEGGASDPAAKLNAGNLAGKILNQGDVKMTFVNTPTMPTRYFYTSSKQTPHLQMIKDAKMRITAPEGYAVTKVSFTQNLPTSSSNFVKLEVDRGEGSFDEDTKKIWSGNATSVRFNSTGATYINKIVVNIAPVNTETVTPAANTYDTEANGLAEFNAETLANGTTLKLNLTNAVVTAGMVNEWGHYIQDATSAAHFYCTGLDLHVGDIINGFIYVTKAGNSTGNPGHRIAMAEDTNAENIVVTTGGVNTLHTATLDNVKSDALIAQVVKLENVTVKGSKADVATISKEGTESTLEIKNDKLNYAPYIYQEDMSTLDIADATVTGILFYSNFTKSEMKLYPISIENNGTVGIRTVGADNENVQIYNLQGVRLNQLQRGLNIVNGKKIVVK